MKSQLTEAALVLADGTTFEGVAVGFVPENGIAAGEVVFNTALSGYQEIVTDPSYAGQIITFTYPHIGNYGVTADDDEARAPACRGVIVRDLARRPSNWRARDDLDGFLRRHHIAGIAGIDTRRLTRHIREAGALPGAFGTADHDALLAAAREDGGTDGRDLTGRGHDGGAVHRRSARRGLLRRRVRLRDQAFDPRPARRGRLPGRGRAGRHVGAARCSTASPTACSSRTVRAIPPPPPARNRT